MSRVTISDRRSLVNLSRELGHPVYRVARLEVHPEDGPPGKPRVTASLGDREDTVPEAPTPPDVADAPT